MIDFSGLIRRLAFMAGLSIGTSYAQENVSQIAVSADNLKQHVFALASDRFQGRKTGTDGQLQAATYCTQAFRRSHLSAPFRLDSVAGSFRQTFAFTATQVALYGGTRSYGSRASTYQRNELAPLPQTADDSSRTLFGQNVGGLIIGTDLKQEVVVISAHYDHLGAEGKRIFYGADDNASGTATVLGVSAVFDSLRQVGIRSRRSILFVLFSGEESGLLGSSYFIYNSPLPLSQLVCDLNVDMVGRVDDAHRKKPNYCYLLTNKEGQKLQRVAENSNAQSVNLAINEGGYDTVNDPEQYFSRSDHYNFARNNIPALFFTNGTHIDYHKLTDTADRINYEVLAKRATLVFQTAWTLANQNEK
jgi:Zn-dependent M28 family amino/carboxypeptidase